MKRSLIVAGVLAILASAGANAQTPPRPLPTPQLTGPLRLPTCRADPKVQSVTLTHPSDAAPGYFQATYVIVNAGADAWSAPVGRAHVEFSYLFDAYGRDQSSIQELPAHAGPGATMLIFTTPLISMLGYEFPVDLSVTITYDAGPLPVSGCANDQNAGNNTILISAHTLNAWNLTIPQIFYTSTLEATPPTIVPSATVDWYVRAAGTCAAWLDPSTRARGTYWIAGYWDGRNAAAGAGRTDRNAVLDEAVRICRAAPTTPLSTAVETAYAHH